MCCVRVCVRVCWGVHTYFTYVLWHEKKVENMKSCRVELARTQAVAQTNQPVPYKMIPDPGHSQVTWGAPLLSRIPKLPNFSVELEFSPCLGFFPVPPGACRASGLPHMSFWKLPQLRESWISEFLLGWVFPSPACAVSSFSSPVSFSPSYDTRGKLTSLGCERRQCLLMPLLKPLP